MRKNSKHFLFLCLILWADITVIKASEIPTLLWHHTFSHQIMSCKGLKNFSLKKDGQLIFPLQAVMTQNNLIFMNSSGKIFSKLPTNEYDQVCLSDNGNFFGALKNGTFGIYNPKNNLQYQIEINAIPFVAEHYICQISPFGDWFCIISWFTQTISFYSNTGRLMASHKGEDLKQSRIVFSKNNEWAAIHAPNWGQGNTRGYVQLFDRDGHRQYTFYHQGCNACLDMASDGQFLAIADEKCCYVINREGQLILKTNVPRGISKPAISNDGNYLTIASNTDHSISLWDIKQKKLEWSIKLDGFDTINSSFTGIDISGKERKVVVSERQHWSRKNSNSRLSVFNFLGEQEWQKQYSNSQIYPRFSEDGRCFLVFGDCDVFFMYWKK